MVSDMASFYSPLRYPGGKQKLADFISQICVDNNIFGHYVEPYAGGASVALQLLLTGKMSRITINDLDRAIYAFWWAVINTSEELCKRVQDTSISVEEWYKQKAAFANKEHEGDLLKLGFAALFLNRTNYSGVLNGGMIGGNKQKGAYKINCRFNKEAIIQRIKAIADFGDRIQATNLDALDLIDSIESNANTIFYFDPPYYIKGQCLYMNHYKRDDHRAVCERIMAIKNAQWIVSYDDTAEIHELYSGAKHFFNYKLRHSVHASRSGKETIFLSDGLHVGLKAKSLLVESCI